jgi:hypothetical protein
MNLYLVVSEELTDHTYGPQAYCICELVVADKPSQAKYLAWKSDRNTYCPDDIREMPKMRCVRTFRDVPGPARIASGEHSSDELDDECRLWLFPEEIEKWEVDR